MNEFSIHDAAREGDLCRVRQLIEAGVSVDHLNKERQIPLHLAARYGQYEVADLLINCECDLDMKDRYGCTPLMCAADWDRKNIVDLLLHRGAQVNYVDDRGRTLLHHASANGWMDIVTDLLINSKCDINIKDRCGDTPLMCAAHSGKKNIVDLLLHRGAQVNYVDYRGRTLLHHASANGWTDIVRLILDNGEADLNAADERGSTPLMLAAERGKEEVTAVLIQAGADVNRSDVIKRTALHCAAEFEHTRVIQILLEKEGLDLSPQDIDGDTPLHLASCEDSFYREAMKQLLDAGADTNVKNNQGKTALSEGLRDLSHEEIWLFVQNGAFLENCDYEFISQDSFLKVNLLKDVELCTQSVVNKFNRQSLTALKSITYFAKRLPDVDNFKLRARQIDEVENLVKCEIERNTFCNVVKVRPIALSALCVLSLITCQSGEKRAASPEFGHSPFKKIHN